MLRALVVILLALLLIAVLPVWPYTLNRGWGYYPSGAIVLLVLLYLVVVAAGGKRTV